jgi:hypothetical protein
MGPGHRKYIFQNKYKVKHVLDQVPFWSRKVPGVIISISTVLLMVALVCAAVFGVILYRMSMVAALSLVDQVSHYSIRLQHMRA